MNQNEMENSLRAVLVEHARRAPTGELLADQIIATAGSPTVRTLRTHRRRAWTLPLLTAAAVAAVVAGTVTLSSLHPSASRAPSPKPGQAGSGNNSSVLGQPAPTVHNTTVLVPKGEHLQAFRAEDLTFTSQNDIWALGSATCLSTGVGRCTALLHTTGTKWSMVSSTPFNVSDVNSCADPCATHIRFANDQIGYVYSPSTLKMTTNGGKSWQIQSGGAVALETADNNVIRVTAKPVGGCPPGCTFSVQTAAIGSSTWHTVPISVPSIDGVGASLARSGHDAYLLFTGNPAGGAQGETSALFSSTNDGATWTSHGEICPQNPGQDGEVDSTALTTGSDDSVLIACSPRLASGSATPFVEVSTDSGASFSAANKVALTTPSLGQLAAATKASFCVMATVLECTQDGGKSYAPAQGSRGGPSTADWMGFESTTEGHVLEVGGSAANGAISQLWTTTDAGKTWTVSTITT